MISSTLCLKKLNKYLVIKVHTLLISISSMEVSFSIKFKNLWTCLMLVLFHSKDRWIRWIRFRKPMMRKVLNNNLAPMLKNRRNLKSHNIKIMTFLLLLMRLINNKWHKITIKSQLNTKSNRKYKSKANKSNNKRNNKSNNKSKKTSKSRIKTCKWL